jgi:hypothetical protein
MPHHQFTGWTQTLQHVQEHLGPEAFDAATSRGHQMTYADAVTYTLAELDRLLLTT